MQKLREETVIPIAAPQIGPDEKHAVEQVLDSGIIAAGPRVTEFEQAFAGYCGTEYAVAVNSGTAALHAALLAHGIGAGDEVITSPFSFIASANSILYTGAKPVFADIEADTFILDPEQVAEKITAKTKAILPVHLYGHPADMDALGQLAEDHGLALIEDACQAHGAEHHGRRVGSFGTGCFSFYPTKNMTTSEGGVVTTDDKDVAAKARVVRQHGMNQQYLHETLGYNLRMTDIAAAIGIVQLSKLDMWNSMRQSNAKHLTNELVGSQFTTPSVRKDCTHVFHQYTIRCPNREQVKTVLSTKHIGYGVYYPLPIHQQPLYKQLGYKDSMPEAEKAAQEVLSLPIHPAVTHTDLEYIAEKLNTL